MLYDIFGPTESIYPNQACNHLYQLTYVSHLMHSCESLSHLIYSTEIAFLDYSLFQFLKIYLNQKYNSLEDCRRHIQ